MGRKAEHQQGRGTLRPGPRPQETKPPMAEQRYFIINRDTDNAVYATEPMDALDAYQDLATTRGLLIITGWEVEACACGFGIQARKGDLVRRVHMVPEEKSEESTLLALGLLAPASHRAGLLEVPVEDDAVEIVSIWERVDGELVETYSAEELTI